MSFITSNIRKIKQYISDFRYFNRKKKIIHAGVLLLIVFLVGMTIFRSTDSIEDIPIVQKREVDLRNVLELSLNQEPLQITGKVRSLAEANLRTETQGEVVGVYRTVGDFISAGSIIAEISNASERASVLQAEGSVEQAEASLDKLQSGTRDEQLSILEINSDKARGSYVTAKSSAVSDLLSVYASVDDAIVTKADLMFSNITFPDISFNIPTSNTNLVNQLVTKRISIGEILNRRQSQQLNISADDDLITEITQTQSELRAIGDFLASLVAALNTALSTASISESDIATFKTNTTASRISINGKLSTLDTTLDNLNTKKTALSIAEKNLEQGQTGERSEDVTVAEAQLKQANGALRSAQARLEKTLIRTPISGTINTLSLNRGDFVSLFELAAIVSNNSSLEIQSFITDEDRQEIRNGTKARIQGTYDGVVTSISPGLDPLTRKIEIRIAIQDEEVTLTHGSTIRLTIERTPEPSYEEDTVILERITIPIAALKVEANRIIVFTVNGENELIAHEVEEGVLLGEKIVINSGLTGDMNIVVDARGLNEGQIVVIKK